jgi:acyl dehydratase
VKVGDSASQSLLVTDEVVRGFATVVGDQNPVHLDDNYAASTRFKKRIAHGMLGASLISAVLGMKLPGPGTIYLSQSLQFSLPVFIGEEITATVLVTKLREDKPIATLETVCKNQKGEIVLKGEAVVLVPRDLQSSL